MNTIIGIVSILLFHGIWNDEHVVICSVFIIINQIILLLVSILLDDSIYNIHWFYQLLIIYFQFCLYMNRIFNDITYQSKTLLSIWMVLSIWTMNRYYQKKISKLISNTSYSMIYEPNRIVLRTIIYSINSWFAPDQQESVKHLFIHSYSYKY